MSITQKTDKPISVGDDGSVVLKHKQGELLFGSRDECFVQGIAGHILSVANPRSNNLNDKVTSYVASMVEGAQPRDPLEAMLATQMAAIHMASMQASDWLQSAKTLQQIDNAEKALNKLCRTFAVQMETLKKYRTETPQVKVRDLNVSDGGQAIVGNVSTGKSENEKN
ncbi:MAG: hypothetical protein ABJP66_00290 [Hyphomicrobiales bacterium]